MENGKWYLTKNQNYSQSGRVQAEVIAKGATAIGGVFKTKLQGFEAQSRFVIPLISELLF